MKQKQITTEYLEAERLWFERHCAATLLQALADSGMLMNELDQQLGKSPGYTLRYIGRLAKGKTGAGRQAVDLAAAMGARIVCKSAKLSEPHSA